jgi:hypothetical protein
MRLVPTAHAGNAHCAIAIAIAADAARTWPCIDKLPFLKFVFAVATHLANFKTDVVAGAIGMPPRVHTSGRRGYPEWAPAHYQRVLQL